MGVDFFGKEEPDSDMGGGSIAYVDADKNFHHNADALHIRMRISVTSPYTMIHEAEGRVMYTHHVIVYISIKQVSRLTISSRVYYDQSPHWKATDFL